MRDSQCTSVHLKRKRGGKKYLINPFNCTWRIVNPTATIFHLLEYYVLPNQSITEIE